MKSKKPTYKELEEKLRELEVLLNSKENTNVDALPGDQQSLVIQLKSATEENDRLVSENVLIHQQWEKAFHSINSCIWILDKEQRVVQTNNVCINGLDFSKGKSLGKCCFGLVHGNEDPISECPLIRAKLSLKRESMEMEENGHWYDVIVDPILNNKGQYEGCIHIITDITERKRAEEDLRKSEINLRSIIENSPVGYHIYMLESDNRLIFRMYNPSSDRLLHTDHKQFIGRDILDAFPALAGTGIPELYMAVAKGELKTQNFVNPYNYKGINGVYDVRAFQGEQGQVVVNFTDITERIQAEENLKKSEERFRVFMDTIPDMIFIKDKNLRYLFADRQTTEFFGKSYDEIIGKTDLEITKNEYFSLDSSSDKMALERNALITIEENLGDQIFETTKFPLWLPNGDQGIGGVMRNITDRKRAAQSLHESQILFSIFMDHIPGLVLMKDNELRLIYANQTMRENYPTDQWMGKLPEECFPPDLAADMRNHDEAALAAGFECYEETWATKSGAIETYETRKFRIDRPGQTPLLGSLIIDITKRKQAETQLKKLFQAVEQSPACAVITNTEGNIEYINPKFTETTGYKLEEVIGKNPRILKSGEQTQEFYKELWETISAGKEWEGELRNKKKNGELYWEYARISSIKNEDGEILNYIAVKEDITELKQAEINYRHSIDQSPIGIRIVNKEGKTVYANRAFLEIYDVPSLEEFVKTRAKQRYTEESYQEHLVRKKTRQEGGEVSEYEISFRRKNNEIRHIKVWRKEVIWDREKHFQVINQDITEQKTLYHELVLAKERAEESDQLKSSFLANMSHEIRTPMNGILGFIELLQEPELKEDKKADFLNIVYKSGQRLLNTINNIIEISRIDARQVELEKSKFCVIELLKDLTEFFTPEAEAKGLKLQTLLPEGPFEIESDKVKLESVLTNLIKNAIKFTYKGEIKVVLEHTSGKLTIYVSDTGVGITKENAEKIFERFVQGDTGYSRPYEGSGLGLSIAKEYVNLLNGKIWVKSVVNKGTTFYIEFPESELNISAGPLSRPYVPELKVKMTSGNKVILIAEDDEICFEYLSVLLKDVGTKILWAKNGEEALKIAVENDIDVALIDARMPVLDGYKVTREILKVKPDLPVIMQTAFAFSDDKEKALSVGCVGYLSKPISRQKFLETILKYLV